MSPGVAANHLLSRGWAASSCMGLSSAKARTKGCQEFLLSFFHALHFGLGRSVILLFPITLQGSHQSTSRPSSLMSGPGPASASGRSSLLAADQERSKARDGPQASTQPASLAALQRGPQAPGGSLGAVIARPGWKAPVIDPRRGVRAQVGPGSYPRPHLQSSHCVWPCSSGGDQTHQVRLRGGLC